MSSPQRPVVLLFLFGFALAGPMAAQGPAPKEAEAKPAEKKTDALSRIREEGMERSQVMATLSHLTDVIGPRLTGSPGLRRANEWTRDKFTAWGLVNAHLEPWGPFGRGWELKRFSAQVVSPQSIPLIAYPKAWSPGLGSQPFEAEVVHVDIKKSEDLEKYRGKLRGKIVLDGSVQEMKVNFEQPLARRRTETQLLALANSDGTAAPRTSTTVAQAAAGIATNPLASPEQRAALAFTPRRYQFFSEEGVAVLLQPSRTGEAGNLFTAGATVYPPRSAEAEKSEPAVKQSKKKKGGDTAKKSTTTTTTTTSTTITTITTTTTVTNRGISPWKTDAPPIVPQLTLAAEHYNRLVRMTQAGEKLRVAVELQANYLDADLMAANTVAEIPGSDLANEVVMLGAHLDSWHSGTGATDNAAGCSVVMEVVRILQALELKPRRTIRIALWTGEEQGLLGSKAYVTEHFGVAKNAATPGAAMPRDESDPSAMTARTTVPEVEKKPEHDRLSAYFNLDNGGGKIRGVYLQNNEGVRPLFRQWLKPFKDLGAETTSLSSTSGTDHLSFDNVGLPGFQFIQDEIEYNTRTHHGNMDLYDRIVADDLKQASVIMATFVYQAAMLDEKIPRKPSRPAAASGPTAAANATQ